MISITGSVFNIEGEAMAGRIRAAMVVPSTTQEGLHDISFAEAAVGPDGSIQGLQIIPGTVQFQLPSGTTFTRVIAPDVPEQDIAVLWEAGFDESQPQYQAILSFIQNNPQLRGADGKPGVSISDSAPATDVLWLDTSEPLVYQLSPDEQYIYVAGHHAPRETVMLKGKHESMQGPWDVTDWLQLTIQGQPVTLIGVDGLWPTAMTVQAAPQEQVLFTRFVPQSIEWQLRNTQESTVHFHAVDLDTNESLEVEWEGLVAHESSPLLGFYLSTSSFGGEWRLNIGYDGTPRVLRFSVHTADEIETGIFMFGGEVDASLATLPTLKYHDGEVWQPLSTGEGVGQFIETDPTVPAHVKAITQVDINNWLAAFGWGNHATQGYLKSETDPTVPSYVKAITQAQLENWQAAFGWGNHATQGYLKSETDPTVPNHVKTITVSDLSNWNETYMWGNHANAGYLTSETDPTVPSHVKAISTVQIDRWATAFGWGNHANAGYLTSETDPTVPAHVKAITQVQLDNWAAAFGWGNHASAGYLTSFTESDPTVPAHVKAITTQQVDKIDAAMRYVIHGDNANMTRPPGPGPVTWYGIDYPTEALDYDQYIPTA